MQFLLLVFSSFHYREINQPYPQLSKKNSHILENAPREYARERQDKLREGSRDSSPYCTGGTPQSDTRKVSLRMEADEHRDTALEHRCLRSPILWSGLLAALFWFFHLPAVRGRRGSAVSCGVASPARTTRVAAKAGFWGNSWVVFLLTFPGLSSRVALFRVMS